MADKVFAGMIVLADRIIENGYVLVGDGKVRSVGSGSLPDGERHGGQGFFVLPGAIDAQVHSRSQLGQEDFVWSTRSAAAGGVTTIVDMPYDDNCLIATAERFRTKVREAGAQARVDFALYATIDPDEGAARVDELVRPNIVAEWVARLAQSLLAWTSLQSPAPCDRDAQQERDQERSERCFSGDIAQYAERLPGRRPESMVSPMRRAVPFTASVSPPIIVFSSRTGSRPS